MSVLKQYYNTGDDNSVPFYWAVWIAQTFEASDSYTINSIKLDKIKAVENLQWKIIQLMKLDKNVFQENIKLLKDYMLAIREAADGNVDSLQNVMDKISEVIKESLDAQTNATANIKVQQAGKLTPGSGSTVAGNDAVIELRKLYKLLHSGEAEFKINGPVDVI